MAGIDVLLRKIDEGRKQIHTLYVSGQKVEAVSDELLYAIRTYVQDLQSALDWTATAVAKACLPPKPGSWRPYFPLASAPIDFPAALEKELKGLATAHPNVAATFERHQPYQPAKTELGYLHALTKVNKHEDFTAQTFTAFQGRETVIPGARIFTAAGGSSDSDTFTIRRPDGRVETYPISQQVETFYDRFFVDPPVRVMETLDVLGTQVLLAVKDIRLEAGL